MDLLTRDHIDYCVGGVHLDDIPNYNEKAVADTMRDLDARGLLPRAPDLIEDIYALALNLLPAQYIQPTSAAKYRRHFALPQADIEDAVRRAVQKVMGASARAC